MAIAPAVLQAIRERGPLSSIDLDHAGTVDWFWGPTRLARATLEILYAVGEVTIHHRIGTRRFFELTEKLLPADLLAAPDPNQTVEEYQNWHVLRRVGGLGLAKTGAGEYWYGILDVKTEARQTALARLVEQGDLAAVAVEGVPNRTFFIRTADLPTLQIARTRQEAEPQAAILGCSTISCGPRPAAPGIRFRLCVGSVQAGRPAQVWLLCVAGDLWRSVRGPL